MSDSPAVSPLFMKPFMRHSPTHNISCFKDGFLISTTERMMDSKNGLFARMPYRSYKDRNGDMKYSDTVFAMNETSRNAINDAVLAAYEQRLHMEQDEAPDMEESIDESPGMVQSM